MKILKRAAVDTWKHVFTCSKCDSELEADHMDLVHVHSTSDMREPSYDSYHVVCAVCSQKQNILTTSIPKLIQLEAQKRSNNTPGYL